MKNKFTQVPETPHILLKSSFWVKDSHGLYDYQAPQEQYINEIFYIDNQTKVYRDSSNSKTVIKSLACKGRNSQKNLHIGNILINKNNPQPSFAFQSPSLSQAEEQFFSPYQVIKKQNQDYLGFALRPGNVIKLGRVQMVVIEIRNNLETEIIEQQLIQQQHSLELQQVPHDVQNLCKICWENHSDKQNPLLSPCKCKGSCSFIHLDCLKKWINSKVKKERNGIVMSYNFNKLQCEICKTSYSDYIKVNGSLIQMMPIEKPDKPYLMLLTNNNKNQHKQQKTLHMIVLNQFSIAKIGRGHNCEIRVNDISVSRNHCTILFHENQFYLRDAGAKFGTLVRFTGKVQQILPGAPFKIQLGRAIMEFQLKGLPSQVDTA